MEHNEQYPINGIVQCMSDGLMVIGADGVIRRHNPAAEEILGLTGTTLTGQNVSVLMKQAEENDTFFADILESVREQKKIVKTVPYFRGEEMLYLRITTNLMQCGGEEAGIIAEITDITEATMLFIANKRLANQVMNLMNSFVEVMVTAIEEKSTYNANHTKSMVRYAAKYLDWLSDQGKLTDFTSENTAPLIMSVWLHDIGKLLVPQEILDKPTRLGNAEKDIRHRIETARLMLRIEALQNPGRADEIAEKHKQLDEAEQCIFSANTAGFLDNAAIERLSKAAQLLCTAADGSMHPLLTEDEFSAVTVQRGTLTPEERKIVESHVTYTRKLLSKVEFRGDYKPVTNWASGHHELLDGSGYPEHLSGAKIPWETRLITIIDVYDALPAEDRPYKPPMPPEKAFAILRDMAAGGKIDADILNSFIESGAWKREPKKS